MRDRRKELQSYNGEYSFFDGFSGPSELPCRRHPPSSSSSNGGICPLCLRDKLAELVCPNCGEQRLPTCSCSDFSSDPNSYPEFERNGRGNRKTGEPVFLKRSNSTCADVKNRAGFWKIGKIFRKKKEKVSFGNVENSERKEIPVGVPRSRSLCSFRGGGNGGFFYDTEESGGAIHSAARVSSVSGGFMMDSAKMSCFSESEARMSNFEGRMSNFEYERDMMARGIYSMREGCEFINGEDPKFIDLKLDLPSSSSEVRTDHSVFRQSGYGSMRNDMLGSNEVYGMFRNGESSGRFSGFNEGELKKCRKSRKVWKWFFRG